jgi:dipeptidase E
MKLLLCSEGFHTPNTVQACVDLVGKPQDKISVAIIDEAYAVEEGDKRWVLDNLNDVAQNFPAEIDIVNLLALSLEEVEARISKKDAIFVIGGNSDYQMQVFTKTGFAKLLPKLLETKVYVGSSAGSMVLGRRVSSETYEAVFGERNDFGITDFMGLVNLAIIPHLDSDGLPHNRAAVLEQVVPKLDFPVYGLRDDSALVVDGNTQRFIGSEPVKIVNGKNAV